MTTSSIATSKVAGEGGATGDRGAAAPERADRAHARRARRRTLRTDAETLRQKAVTPGPAYFVATFRGPMDAPSNSSFDLSIETSGPSSYTFLYPYM